MTLTTARAGLALVISALALGCSSSTETGPKGSDGNTGGTGMIPDVIDEQACKTNIIPGRTPLRRLTATEYNNTVFELLQDSTRPADRFPPAVEAAGFLNNADAYQTNDKHVEEYFKAAEKMAAEFRTRGGLTLPCAAQAESCAKEFINSFGKRAFRRPLTAAEVDSYYARFLAGSTGATFEDGLEWVVGRMLQSPFFLYRVELDGEGTTPGQVVQLSDYSVATRLSYFLWQSMPDAALFAAADAEQLSTPEGVAEQTARMMADPRFEATLNSFHSQWLHWGKVFSAEKVAMTGAAWTGLQNDMVRDTELFVKSIFDSKGSLNDLLTAKHAFLSPELATLLGVTHPTGSGYARVDNVPGRHGLLTSPALMAGHAHPDQSAPVKRGEMIRRSLLCTEPLPPPPGLMIEIPVVTPGSTTRERFEQHRSEPACAGCHVSLDPLGMPLENYDELGRWRDMDGGKPVDARGELTQVDSLSATPEAALVNGPIELGTKLSALPEVQDCMVANWFRYAMGHAEEEADTCTMNELLTRFDGSQQNLHDLVVGIATSNGFRYRADLQ